VSDTFFELVEVLASTADAVAASGTAIDEVDSEGDHVLGGRERRGVVGFGPRSILFIRVVYNGVDPNYCDEDCVLQNMWTGEENLNGLFTEISRNKISFPPTLGKIVTVYVNDGQHEQDRSCQFWKIGLEADAAVRDQLGFEPEEYNHRSYFIPISIKACRWHSCNVSPSRWLRVHGSCARPPLLLHSLCPFTFFLVVAWLTLHGARGGCDATRSGGSDCPNCRPVEACGGERANHVGVESV
jgi:hypothetical protein